MTQNAFIIYIHVYYKQKRILKEFSPHCSHVVEKIVSDLMMQVQMH